MLSKLIFKTSTYHRDHPGWYLDHQGCLWGWQKYLKFSTFAYFWMPIWWPGQTDPWQVPILNLIKQVLVIGIIKWSCKEKPTLPFLPVPPPLLCKAVSGTIREQYACWNIYDVGSRVLQCLAATQLPTSYYTEGSLEWGWGGFGPPPLPRITLATPRPYNLAT